MERKVAKRWINGVLTEEYVNLGPGGAVLRADPATHMVSKTNPAHSADGRARRYERAHQRLER